MSTIEKSPPKTQARGLGKGLSALMGEASYDPPKPPAARERSASQEEGQVRTMPIDDILPGKFQPRNYFDQMALVELADSIRRNGIVQPLVVRRGAHNKFEIIAGERRWRAAAMAGLRAVPVIVREFTDKQALETALLENIQREDLNPLEEGAAYQRLMNEFDYTQEELAGVVHKSRSHIANLLRLLELPEEIRRLLLEEKISMGHARALSGVPDAVLIAQEIVEKNLNVRQTEKLVRFGRETGEYRPRKPREREAGHTVAVAPPAAPVAAPVQPAMPAAPAPAQMPEAALRTYTHRDPDIMALEETLSENLGLKVSINDRGQSGEITISYESLEQLDDILRRLGGSI